MKKFKIKNSIGLLLVTLCLIFFSSCTEEEKIPGTKIERGTTAFAKFEETPPAAVGVDQVSEVNYSFTITDPNNNMVSYELQVYANLGGVETEVFDLAETTEFPHEFTFSIEELANAIGVEVSDINFGDTFYFTATATDLNGEVVTYEEISFDDADDDDPQTFDLGDGVLSAGLRTGAGYRQAFAFDFVILCPEVNLSDLVGTYQVTYDWFFEESYEVEIVQGMEDNQLIIKDMYAPVTGQPGYDVVLDIDMSDGSISVAHQPVFDTDAFGWGYGVASVESTSGTNYAFSCSGKIALNLEWTVSLGSFGSGPFLLSKIN